MKKIKCQYCGRKYSPENDRDCCPACGAFNELPHDFFDEPVKKHKQFVVNIHTGSKNSSGVSSKIFKLIKKIFLGYIIYNIFLVILGAILMSSEDNEYQYIDVVYSDDILNRDDLFLNYPNADKMEKDYHLSYTITGRHQDLIELIDCVTLKQLNRYETYVTIKDGKISHLGNTIYLDSMRLSWSSYGSLMVNIEIESNGRGDIPKEFEMYLISDDNKIRVREYEYGITYTDGIETMSDLFTNAYTGEVRLEAVSGDFIEFKTFQIVIDEEVYEFELSFKDSKAELSYYGLKETN